MLNAAQVRRSELTPDRIRGLRGLIHHVLRGRGSGRAPAKAFLRGGEWGVCRWCLKPVEPSRRGNARKWHPSCLDWKDLAGGHRLNRFNNDVGLLWKEDICQACGAEGVSLEMDHILAIKVAERLGKRFYVRAFTPDNIWWICRECHKAKTRFDRMVMRQIDNPVRDDPPEGVQIGWKGLI